MLTRKGRLCDVTASGYPGGEIDMIVMLILMLLPILAIPVFWFLPLGQAVIVYLLSLLLSGWMFWLMRRNKKYPVTTGREGLIGREAEAISTSTIGRKTAYTVRVEGELWTARSSDTLKQGETVIIIAVDGSILNVKRKKQER
jgi:membrane protein implicated in regulation of membrane protease activity